MDKNSSLKNVFSFKNGVKSIQTAGYNGARTLYGSLLRFLRFNPSLAHAHYPKNEVYHCLTLERLRGMYIDAKGQTKVKTNS